ncbi:APC family permease [Rothia nasimurium]|uniref:APC family permease n=1 Tax=Rothia nasimurium TaxID=85336 RepID=UPI002DD6B78D|nr:APC family permease [Rothia nasimurium]
MTQPPATPGAHPHGSVDVSAANKKGLSSGNVTLFSSIIIGISVVAPAYSLSGALGPVAAEAGIYMPAMFLIGFIPMLLVAIGYRELNAAMPDAGTTFTWTTKAFGPYVGWMGVWALLVATILVLSNLAGIAVDFFYLFLSQALGSPDIADLAANNLVNIATFLAFMAFGCYITYRGLDATQKLQTVLIIFQLIVLALFSAVALYKASTGTGFANLTFSLEWFNPFGIDSFSTLAASMSLVFFLYWGWDAVLTMNEETEGKHTTSGTAAVGTILTIVVLYLFLSVGTLSFAGTSEDGLGLGNPDNQENIFAALSGPVLGSLGILMSIAVMVAALASLQSTAVSPARTLLAMGYYRALGPKFARLSPKYQAPSYATIASCLIASVFYVAMRFISTSVLWDTIAALSLMVCLYYGVTAFACVWYFRKTSLKSGARNLFNQFILPLIGGIILVVFFAQTFVDSMDPAYGSGSEIGGIGLVFILSLVLLALGVAVMLYQRFKRPDFFVGRVPMDIEHMLDLPE